MKKTAITHEIELATGTETFVHPETPSDTDSMALAIKEILDSCSMNDSFSMSNIYLNLKQANGQPENMFPLELGRAQGFLKAYCELSGRDNSDKRVKPSTESHPFSRPPKVRQPSEDEIEGMKNALQRSSFKPVNIAEAFDGPDV